MNNAARNARIAREWMGWEPYHFVGGRLEGWYCYGWPNGVRDIRNWAPTTNLAHAAEARLRADSWTLRFDADHAEVTCLLYVGPISPKALSSGRAYLHETHDRALAECEATCRAIEAALDARAAEAAKETA